MKKIFLFLVILLILPAISALCSEEQININAASLEKLDELFGIGPAKAQAIIDSRPYETLDDLINSYGIGEKTLDNIKNQGLACVEGNEEQISDEEKVEEINTPKENIKISEKNYFVEFETIELNSKDIKSDDNLKLDNNDYAIYTFIAFCVLLAFLFIVKKRKYSKNEFN